jgi:hypothetical protein
MSSWPQYLLTTSAKTLLLAITYLDQLQNLLIHQAERREPTAGWEISFTLAAGIRPAQ